MTEPTTSPLRAETARAEPIATTTGEWRRLAGFLRRPRLPDRAAGFSGRALAGVMRLLGLDLLAMGALGLIAVAVIASGVTLPETALAGVDVTSVIVLAVVIFAPLGEEIAFRGWLSGRPGHLLAIAILAAGAFVLTQTDLAQSDAAVNFKAIGGVLAALAGAVAALILLRKRAPMAWFARFFPLFFWLSTVAFACVHLLNFEDGALYVLLPLVLPQFVLGSILGYARVTYGLWASILLHALHNGIAIGLVMLASSLVPATAG